MSSKKTYPRVKKKKKKKKTFQSTLIFPSRPIPFKKKKKNLIACTKHV